LKIGTSWCCLIVVSFRVLIFVRLSHSDSQASQQNHRGSYGDESDHAYKLSDLRKNARLFLIFYRCGLIYSVILTIES
jgi:hypothetical protein